MEVVFKENKQLVNNKQIFQLNSSLVRKSYLYNNS